MFEKEKQELKDAIATIIRIGQTAPKEFFCNKYVGEGFTLFCDSVLAPEHEVPDVPKDAQVCSCPSCGAAGASSFSLIANSSAASRRFMEIVSVAAEKMAEHRGDKLYDEDPHGETSDTKFQILRAKSAQRAGVN